MQLALSSKAIRTADELAMTRARIPSMDLMETAGREAAGVIKSLAGDIAGKHVACFCGTGNNGGDGFVMARYLLESGARLSVVKAEDNTGFTADAATNFRRLSQLADRGTEPVEIFSFAEARTKADNLRGAHFVVDALLGTGLTSDLRDDMRETVAFVNELTGFVVSIDVPTGIDSDTGEIRGDAVWAQLTVAMAALKTGLVIGDGIDRSGHVSVVDIGIPADIIRQAGNDHGMVHIPDDDDIREMLPVRRRDDYKYSIGLVGIVGGSRGLTGAPSMAALAAHRTGAGAVMCAAPESVEPLLATSSRETMTYPIPEDHNGIVPGSAVDVIKKFRKARCVLIGPGLGRSDAAGRFVREFLGSWEGPAIVDADALVALADADMFEGRADADWILTPHAGEFRRFGSLEGNRVEVVRDFAVSRNVVLVLKGTPTLVGSPDGKVWLGRAGTKGLGKAGSGDMLAGMIAAFRAQGLSSVDAAVCALHIGALASDRYSETRSELSMLPTDLVFEIPGVLHDLMDE